MALVEHQDSIVQPGPLPGPRVDRLRSDDISQSREAFQDYHIGVNIDPSVLVEEDEAEQVGEVLADGNLPGLDFSLAQPVEYDLCRGVLEQIRVVRRQCSHLEASSGERFQQTSAPSGVQFVGDDEEASIGV